MKALVYGLVYGFTSCDLVQDRLSGGMPHEWLGVRIGCCEVLLGGGDQLWDTVEVAPTDLFLRQFPEPPFHQIQPRRTRGGEVQLEPGMPRQPLSDLGLRVGPIVVDNQMEVQVLGKLPVQPP